MYKKYFLQAHASYLDFIVHLNGVVKGKSLSDPCNSSEAALKLQSILETLDGWVDEIPPQEQPQRFGNKSFRDWHKKLDSVMPLYRVTTKFEYKCFMT